MSVRAALALAALVLAGCETTQEKSARLERARTRRQGLGCSGGEGTVDHPAEHLDQGPVGRGGPRLRRRSDRRDPEEQRRQGPEGSAAPVCMPALTRTMLRDWRRHWCAQRSYRHTARRSGSTTRFSPPKRRGPSRPPPAKAPRCLELHRRSCSAPTGWKLNRVAARSCTGTVANRSAVAQKELVVYVVASRGATVLAAGRAVLANLAAGASSPFEVFLIGRPAKATLELAAPPTTFR